MPVAVTLFLGCAWLVWRHITNHERTVHGYYVSTSYDWFLASVVVVFCAAAITSFAACGYSLSKLITGREAPSSRRENLLNSIVFGITAAFFFNMSWCIFWQT